MALLPVDIAATYADSDVDPSVDLHQHHHDLIHAAVNNQVSKGDLVLDLRDQPGVVGDGRTDDAAALQSALDNAAALGARAFARGTFRTTRTLQVSGNADLSDATIRYDGTGTAVLVGATGADLNRRTVRLPEVIATRKTRVGWGQVAGSVGVVLRNCSNVDVSLPHVRGFETGLQVEGVGRGTAYCNVVLGHLDNNLVNLRFRADATGWANQNNFSGGRLSHDSNEGTRVAGSRQVLVEPAVNVVNNNTFWGTSLESGDVVELHLDCAGNDNYFLACRWENRGSGARVCWRAGSTGNVIAHGFAAAEIVETKEARTGNLLTTRSSARFVGTGGPGEAVVSLENTASSARAALRVMGAGAQSSGAEEKTAWAVEVSAARTRLKRPTDRAERVGLDHLNGRVLVGDGTAAPTRWVGALGSVVAVGGASLGFEKDNTYDVGAPSRRPRYVRAATGVQTGAFPTRSRPSPAAAGVGTSVFDTTLRKPVWSTGTAWVDARGTVV